MSEVCTEMAWSGPGCTGLRGAGSDSVGLVRVPRDLGGLDCRVRLYSKGEYFSKLDSSLLGGMGPGWCVLERSWIDGG